MGSKPQTPALALAIGLVTIALALLNADKVIGARPDGPPLQNRDGRRHLRPAHGKPSPFPTDRQDRHEAMATPRSRPMSASRSACAGTLRFTPSGQSEATMARRPSPADAG